MKRELTNKEIEILGKIPDGELVKFFPGYGRAMLREVKKAAMDKDIILRQKSAKRLREEITHDKELDDIKNQLALVTKKYKEAIKQANAQQKILEFNELAVKALPTVSIPKLLKIKRGTTMESAVLVGSCWHIGETINKEEMGGMNEYNFDIFVRRFQYLIDTALSFTLGNMSSHKFQDLHIFLTGDMVSGIIHDELESSNQLNIVEQVYLGSLVAAQGILDLARVFPKVIVTCVVGNHGRVGQKKYFKHKQTVSWDYVFYQTLALLLQKQKNVHFNIPMSFWAGVEVQGHKFLIMHGDLVKSWAGIPFYGMNRESSKWMEIMASKKDYFEYFVASHFHTKAILQSATGEKILNASLKGGDEYAAGLGLYGDPVQILFGVHHRYGKTWELSINTKHAGNDPIRYQYDRTKGISQQML